MRRRRTADPEVRIAGDAEAGSAGQRHRATARLRRRRSRRRPIPATRSSGRARRDQGATLVIDSKNGEPRRHGIRSRRSRVLQQQAKNGKQRNASDRSRRRKAFKYEDAMRRATYTGDAHMNGPQGDMTAQRDRAVPEAIGRRTRSRRGLRGGDAAVGVGRRPALA